MIPHRIGLLGPWNLHQARESSSAPIKMPGVLLRPPADAFPISLSRRFQWVAPCHDDERVVLGVRGVIGRGSILLNGRLLGSVVERETTQRFDVTDALQRANEIELRLTGDDKGLAGLAGDVYLSVESRRLSLTGSSWFWDEPDSAAPLRAVLALESGGAPVDVDVTLFLNDQRWTTQSCRVSPDSSEIQLEAGSVDVDEWRPRTWGLPVRQRLTLRITDQRDGAMCYDETWEIGLRRLQVRLDNDHPMIIGRDHERRVRELRWSRERIIALFVDPEGALDDLGSDIDLVIMEGQTAPDRVYTLMDRLGVTAMHLAFDEGNLGPAIDRLSRHPCILR